ncbi:MAG: hypothetical protein ABSG51_06430 [Terracidiphilus sp.]|jgi:hypothetical protein
MKAGRKKILATATVCALALTAAAPERAQANTIPTKSDVVWIGVAIGAIGAGIGIGIYYGFHHGHSLKGCAVSGASGLELKNKGDDQTYTLVGAVSTIKPGERVRVSGKKAKKSAGPAPQFVVEQMSKDYGPCRVNP